MVSDYCCVVEPDQNPWSLLLPSVRVLPSVFVGPSYDDSDSTSSLGGFVNGLISVCC